MIKSVLHPLFLEYPNISSDTRNIKENSLFFALKGPNFNGNKFAAEALHKGAKYAIIDEQEYLVDERFILVQDVLQTLQNLAAYHREYLGVKILALTGSNGKTTTKELLQAVLSQKFNTVATKGNLNNHIGVPLTLLSMNTKTEFGVVEFGANHPKEIEFLCKIAKPDFGLITNFGKAHLEGFGSTDGVIKAKTELYDFLKQHKKLAFINANDAVQMDKSKKLKRVTIGKNADISISLNSVDPFVSVVFKDVVIHSKMIGAYNFSNIAFAVGVGNYFKVGTSKIKDAIENYTPSNNRSQLIKKGTNTFLLDAYNANPTSMKAALDNFLKLHIQNKYIILGDMFELGSSAEAEHQLIVDYLKDALVAKIILLGENFYKTKLPSTKFEKYKNKSDFLKKVSFSALSETNFLIKGSRGMQLEKLLE